MSLFVPHSSRSTPPLFSVVYFFRFQRVHRNVQIALTRPFSDRVEVLGAVDGPVRAVQHPGFGNQMALRTPRRFGICPNTPCGPRSRVQWPAHRWCARRQTVRPATNPR